MGITVCAIEKMVDIANYISEILNNPVKTLVIICTQSHNR